MTLERAQTLCALAIAGVPHVNPTETVRFMRYLTPTELERAGNIYAAILGEPHVPNRPEKPRAPKPKAKPFDHNAIKRNAAARRIIEARRDERAIDA